MIRFQSIKARLVFFSIVAFLSVAVCVSFSYIISIGEIKGIMEEDVSSVADALGNSLEYIASVNPEAYKDENFKKAFNAIKIGKTGYPFLLDEQGTLVVHGTEEGKNLAGQAHIDYIRSHKEPGIYEYIARTTGQDKIVAFRYIKPWRLWVVPGVNKDDYFDQITSLFLKWNLILGLAMIALLTGISYFITTGITRPVRGAVELASRLAGGDFTGKIELERGSSRFDSTGKNGDEFCDLSLALNGMTDGLRGMVANINKTADELLTVSSDISEAAKKVIDAAEVEAQAVNNTSSAMTQINSSVGGIAESVSTVSQSATESSSSIAEMASSMEEMSKNVETLAKSVDEVSSSIVEMAASTKQVGTNIGTLLEAVDVTSSSLAEMDGSIRQIEENSLETASIVEEVNIDATTGKESVQAVIAGMEEIKRSSGITSEVIGTLSERATAIGTILSVINDVAAQTKLLSLNAAIIASQAGEHGKGFSVVADEIKRLAERTSNSIREIESVIKGVQEETKRAVEAIGKAEMSIANGESLAQKSGAALDKIVADAGRASERMGEIARATSEQKSGSNMVRTAMENIVDMVEQIARATNEQENSSELIISNVVKMKDMTNQSRNSTLEQSEVASLISRATQEITAMIRHVSNACDEQRRGSEQVMAAIDEIQSTTEVNLDATQVMALALEKLSEQTHLLKKEMAAFKV